jgi:hypothetical protein
MECIVQATIIFTAAEDFIGTATGWYLITAAGIQQKQSQHHPQASIGAYRSW